MNAKAKIDSYLKDFSGKSSIILSPCDGSGKLLEAKEVFTAGIYYPNPDFAKSIIDKNQVIKTKKTKVRVYEVIKNSTLAQMFGCFETEIERLCLTQHQIKKFCKNHSKWLEYSCMANFFVFKCGGKVAVAWVGVNLAGLNIQFRQLNDEEVFLGIYRHRLIVPQL